MKAIRLQCNYMQNPIGFDMNEPLLSWLTEESGQNRCQTAFQLQVSTKSDFSELLYDTDKTFESESAGIALALNLSPMTRYYWRVRVWNNEDEVGKWSDIAFFETARMDLPWAAQWIGWDKGFPALRKVFKAEKPVARARAYVCGVGLYSLFLNGERVSDEYFNPNFNDYDTWLQYQTFDITQQIHQGENVLGAWLGNGYYMGRVNWPGLEERRCIYGDKLALIAHVEIDYTDGTQETILTDESWQAQQSPFDRAEIYDGEIFDARRMTRWSEGVWENVQLVALGTECLRARLSLPVRVTERLTARLLPKNILDFGQNFSGWVRMHVCEPAGTRIHLHYGEVLTAEGELYTDNLRTAKAELIYICDGEDAEYVPNFTFYGFRYVQVTGVSNLDPTHFTGEVLHSDMPITGTFSCSDERVNRLFLNAMWSQRSNFVDTPTDCPQRDERMGWTGDAQVFCPTACMNMQADAFYRKYLFDLKQEQKKLGFVPVVVPFILRGSGEWLKTVGAWGDAATIIPWDLYIYYGDRETLATQYNSMKRWVDYITHSGNVQNGIYGGFQLGDWLAQDTKDSDNRFGLTPTEFVATAYYAKSAELVSKAAGVLGFTEDEKEYGALAQTVREAFRREFVTPSGRVVAETQTAAALALSMDMLLPEQRAKAAERLAFRLRVDKLHLTTGFVGTPCLCPALSENGYNEYAYALLLSEGCPGWMYEIEMGATTMWERWNSLREDGSFGPLSMNSFNHYAFGSIAEWMYRYVCGINPDEKHPGFRHAILRPMPNRMLTHANASICTPYGRLTCGWAIEDEELQVSIDIPCNATATIWLPDVPDSMENGFIRGSGHWEFRYHFTGETINRCPEGYSPEGWRD